MTCTAVLTCHNRRAQTLACLASLASQQTDRVIRAVLLDDGSTDGTAEAVRREYGWVEVIKGDGSRYWNGGTFDAFTAARAHDPDYYLWLNDDTVLDFDALDRLTAAHRKLVEAGADGLVAGSVRDPISGHHTYGGVRRTNSWWRPAAFERVPPTDSIQHVDTVNGNCVLIPRSIVAAIGVNDPAFTHGIGDFDYGLRANSAGFAIAVAPGTVGTCERNPPAPPLDGNLQQRVGEAWRRATSPKGLPPRDWARFMRRWGGPLWPLFWASPYGRSLLTAVRMNRGRTKPQP
jgi:GT2 family glycosyltransferase